MDKNYNVFWSQTALEQLAGILAYPPDVKERIYVDSFTRLSFMPILTAKQISTGVLEGYWAKLGLYQIILIFEINEEKLEIWVDGIKHKRENVYWKHK